jgi:anti-sigma regulatory factor (Ser/Thr protein kinase)
MMEPRGRMGVSHRMPRLAEEAARRPEDLGDEPSPTGYAVTAAEHQVAAPAAAGGDGPAFRLVLSLSALDLRPLPTAVPCARLHARQVVLEWGFPAIAADCELIVSELVTNAVTHGTSTVTAADLPPVRLRLTGRARGVCVEVWDPSDDMPVLQPDPLGEEPGGRGLSLVAAIARRWGAYRTAGGGKCVFAVLGS